MQNGDSIKGGGWYKELIIIPAPLTDSLYYLINIGVTHDDGLFYNIIDLTENNGLGAVVQKNVQLKTFPCTDVLTATKLTSHLLNIIHQSLPLPYRVCAFVLS